MSNIPISSKLRGLAVLLAAGAGLLAAAPAAQAAIVAPTITQLSLMNADTDQPIPEYTPFESGALLSYAKLPTRALNVQAFTAPEKAGSVVFTVDGNKTIENGAPYALVGDVKGDFLPWTPGAGPHTLTARAYSGSNGVGAAGPLVTVTFTVVAPTSPLLAPWPGAWTPAQAAPQQRVEQASTQVGSKIYLFGGFVDGAYHVTRQYGYYDIETGTWGSLGTLPAGMAETHLGIANDGRYVYLMGGFGGDLKKDETPKQWISDRVYQYDTVDNTWAQIATMPEARGAGGLALSGRQLHYFGGDLADRFTNSGTHFIYDLDTKVWTTGPPMPDPKDHFSTVSFGRKFYAIGGEYGHDIQYKQRKTMHVFDPATNAWTRLADLPLAKSHAEGSTYYSQGKIVMAGGKLANRGPTAQTASYDIAINRWFLLTDLPAARQGTIVAKYQKKIFFSLGGIDASEPQSTTWTAPLP